MRKVYLRGILILLLILIIPQLIYFESGTHVIYTILNVVNRIRIIFWPNHNAVSLENKYIKTSFSLFKIGYLYQIPNYDVSSLFTSNFT